MEGQQKKTLKSDKSLQRKPDLIMDALPDVQGASRSKKARRGGAPRFQGNASDLLWTCVDDGDDTCSDSPMAQAIETAPPMGVSFLIPETASPGASPDDEDPSSSPFSPRPWLKKDVTANTCMSPGVELDTAQVVAEEARDGNLDAEWPELTMSETPSSEADDSAAAEDWVFVDEDANAAEGITPEDPEFVFCEGEEEFMIFSKGGNKENDATANTTPTIGKGAKSYAAAARCYSAALNGMVFPSAVHTLPSRGRGTGVFFTPMALKASTSSADGADADAGEPSMSSAWGNGSDYYLDTYDAVKSRGYKNHHAQYGAKSCEASGHKSTASTSAMAAIGGTMGAPSFAAMMKLTAEDLDRLDRGAAAEAHRFKYGTHGASREDRRRKLSALGDIRRMRSRIATALQQKVC